MNSLDGSRNDEVRAEALDDARASLSIRMDLRPCDIGSIILQHGLYGREQGWDATFEAYVAGPLSECVCRADPRERIWIAEQDGEFRGCIAIVAAAPETAQLRWFFVDAKARGLGLGRRLLNEAVRFAAEVGYTQIVLWTEASLNVAAYLYESAGFRKTAQKPGTQWGADVVEEKFEMFL